MGKTGLKEEELCKDLQIIKEVHNLINEYGRKVKLGKSELPGAIKLIHERWTPDTGLVTAAFKLKRKPIQDKYQREINEMYAAKN